MQIEAITSVLRPFLVDYKQVGEITLELAKNGIEINERAFADYVEEYRKQNHEYYLESCSKGYRFTRDKKAAIKSCWQRIRKGISMIKHGSRDLRMLGEKSQLTLFDGYTDKMEEIIAKQDIVEQYEDVKLDGIHWGI